MQVKKAPPTSQRIVEAMAACHSLVLIDGQLTGDPVDKILFSATGWKMVDDEGLMLSPDESKQLKVCRQFPFASNLQRMSVVAQSEDSLILLCKGAPETVASLCDPISIPGDFADRLQRYTQFGYRVLALATRYLNDKIAGDDVQKVERGKIEKKMTFVGEFIKKKLNFLAFSMG